MGTKFKEVNTLSFIGNIGPKTERVWKEVDEEVDIIGCKDKFERPCQLIAPQFADQGSSRRRRKQTNPYLHQ